MPGLKGAKNVGRNIKEAHTGKTYKKTKAKFGKKTADKQAIAIGMSEAGVGKKKKKGKKRARAKRNLSETEM